MAQEIPEAPPLQVLKDGLRLEIPTVIDVEIGAHERNSIFSCEFRDLNSSTLEIVDIVMVSTGQEVFAAPLQLQPIQQFGDLAP